MAIPTKTFKTKFTACLLFLTILIASVSSSRILEQETLSPGNPTEPSDPVVDVPVPEESPASTPTSTQPNTGDASTSASVASADPHHTLSFFMHDILGGSNPSARAITGIVTNPAVNGQVPFAKPNGANLPLNNGVPQNSGNSGLINNNNIPFLTGLGGSQSNMIQNNNGRFGGAQFPVGPALQKLMFGTITAIDDELTEGHELGSGLVGKAQGFYIVSSEDGMSQTMAFTAMFEAGSYADSLSFFGVHRTAVSQSQLAIMGGTGKFVNAKGFAIVKTLPPVVNHQTTDGLETVLEFTVYVTY